MSHYVVWSRDAADAPALRKAHLAEHLAYAETVMDRIAAGGPLRGADGIDHGSMIVLEADSEAEARAILEADPYFRAGVWERSEILPFKPVIGSWIGGKSW